MNYKLAKELMDAGFPQRDDGVTLHSDKCGGWDNPDPECRDDTRPMVPTLSELIEACGEEFYGLTRIEDDDWYATTFDMKLSKKKGHALAGGDYKTPEEAVARLWLALNKEKV